MMKQVTLLSFYGKKPAPLTRLLCDCLELIQDSPLHPLFRPYDPDQIHGTIVGMEKLPDYSALYNANVWSATGVKQIMDFTPLRPTLQKHLPITFQFGGFPRAFSAFSSFGRSPHERSFQVQWSTHRFTIIGWPHQNGDFVPRRLLNDLRDDLAANCHTMHKWGADNDLFMVLGEIIHLERLSGEELTQMTAAAAALEKQVRNYLTQDKIEVAMSADDIYVAQYETVTLAPDSTVIYKVANPELDSAFIRGLYG